MDDEQEWRLRAACLGHENPELWFPHEPAERGEKQRRETPRLYKEAIKVCRSCEVREECLDYALEANEQYGMWGGLTRPQRATILRLRRREARDAKRREKS